MADHACREPREIEVAAALDQLVQVGIQHLGFGAAHQVLRVHAGGVGQPVPRTGLQCINCGARIEIVEVGAGQGFAELAVHGESGHGLWQALR